MTVDLQDSLDRAGVTTVALLHSVLPASSHGAQLWIHVRPAELGDTVCESGDVYGPFAVGVDAGNRPVTVTPRSASASPTTLRVLNSGTVAVCARIVPEFSATLNVGSVPVTRNACTSAPADIAGTWAGDYSCDVGGPCQESGTVVLTIEQSGASATYTDAAGASFRGSVCGNVFSFKGGVAGSYNESGSFTLNPDGSAAKTSFYRSIAGSCSGRCNDVLMRQ